jgi:hypothetical protein
MAAGKPIIASRLAVLEEVFTDNQNALLCDPERVDQWEAAVRRLLADPELASRLASTARRQFETHHTWSARARDILAAVFGATGSVDRRSGGARPGGFGQAIAPPEGRCVPADSHVDAGTYSP